MSSTSSSHDGVTRTRFILHLKQPKKKWQDMWNSGFRGSGHQAMKDSGTRWWRTVTLREENEWAWALRLLQLTALRALSGSRAGREACLVQWSPWVEERWLRGQGDRGSLSLDNRGEHYMGRKPWRPAKRACRPLHPHPTCPRYSAECL